MDPFAAYMLLMSTIAIAGLIVVGVAITWR
jgi:hypothetical protein